MAKQAYKNVDDYFQQITHSLKEVAEQLRTIIIKTDKRIGEQIKWNSPAFYYIGEMQTFDAKEYKRDILVYNLSKSDCLLLVFPSGNKIPVNSILEDENLKDGRKMIKLISMNDLKAKEKALKNLLKTWLAMVEK